MITFIDIIKEKIKFYIRSNKLENNDVEINEKEIQLFGGIYRLYDDYFEFQYSANTEKLYYNVVNRVSTNNEQATIETINHKSFLLKEDIAFVFIEILKDILQSRDNIFQILKMNDDLSEKQTLKLTEGENKKIDVSVPKEAQIKIALLIEAKKYDEARNLLSSISALSSQNIINYLSSYLQKSEAKFENKPILYYDSLIPALRAANEDKNNSFQLQNLINTYIEYQDNFFSIPQNRRKFVVITDEFYGVPKKGFLMLLKDYALEDTHPLYHSIDTSMITIPDGMSFPVGHPIVNNVYVVHPYNDKFYIPVEEHEEYLFNDRIDEFKTLVQAFGATEIKFSKEHRLKVNQNQSRNLDVNVDVGIKAHGAKVDYNKTNERNNYNNNELTYETSQRSTPILKPYIPKKMVWYTKETTWQRMFKQRTGGNNLLGIEEIISSKSHKTVSSNEIMDINIGLKAFFVKAAVHVKKEIKSSISEEEEMVQKISVTFASVDQLTEEYKEESPIIKQKSIKIDYKNRSTELIPVSFIENRAPKTLPSVVGKNIRIPIFSRGNIYLDMIYVEGGTYWMGTDDPEALKLSPASTLKQVTVDSFYISKYTITRKQFLMIMKEQFAGHSAYLPQWLTKEMIENNDYFGSFLLKMQENTGLRFALPNNHQWEYAARGGKHSKGYKYSGSNDLQSVGWRNKSELAEVGIKFPNELGIYDMSGNVYELVNDIESTGTSFRGGGYWSKSEFCTIYHKINFNDDFKNSNVTENPQVVHNPFVGAHTVAGFLAYAAKELEKQNTPKLPLMESSILKDTIEGYARIGFRVVLPVSEIEKLEVVESNEQLVKVKKT